MKTTESYVDLDGNEIALGNLSADERRLLARLRRRVRTHPDWCDFDNYWMRTVAEFYDSREISRKVAMRRPVYRIAQDLGNRLGIEQGFIRPPDYRGELEELILEQFPSRRAFCKATGLSEDMLSHVLAGRKDLSLGALEEALGRIGYRLRFARVTHNKRTE